jgi:hypothetical protein
MPQQSVARAETTAAQDSKHDDVKQNFQNELGRRFRIDPADLPAPKMGPIVTNRALIVPYAGQAPQVPAGFTATPFATGLVNPRRLLVLPNADILVTEQSAGYLTLLRDDGSGHALWIDRHVEDLNRPYGLAWQGDHVLVADQDGVWSVPHILGALRAGRSEYQRVDQVPPEERKPIAGAYGAKMITQKGVFGIAQGHQNSCNSFSNRAFSMTVAFCCCRASSRSRVTRATLVSSRAADELRGRIAFGAMWVLRATALRRCALVCSPPALDRRRIARQAIEVQRKP